MLSKVLDKKYCAQCRYCCKFIEGDKWETPVIPEDVMKKIKADDRYTAEFDAVGGNSYVFHYDFKDSKEIIDCPVLDSSTGCTLGEDKPFDCKIWPLRVFEKEGRIVIGLSAECPGLKGKEKEIKELLNSGLRDVILNKAKEIPSIVKPYNKSYTIV